MTVQQNVSTLKPSTLRIYGAGGLAVNLLSPYLAKQQNEETKKKFEMIPEAARDQACTQAADALKQAKAAMSSAGK